MTRKWSGRDLNPGSLPAEGHDPLFTTCACSCLCTLLPRSGSLPSVFLILPRMCSITPVFPFQLFAWTRLRRVWGGGESHPISRHSRSSMYVRQVSLSLGKWLGVAANGSARGKGSRNLSVRRKHRLQFCFSLPHHRHFLIRTEWSSWWFYVHSLGGTMLATFPGIAFLLRSQRCVASLQLNCEGSSLLPVELLLYTKEKVLVYPKKSVTHLGDS